MKINSGFAFTSNAKERIDENRKYLEDLLIRIGGPKSYNIAQQSIYNGIKFVLTPLTEECNKITPLEAALIVDHGNLCFGTIDLRKINNQYFGIINTD